MASQLGCASVRARAATSARSDERAGAGGRSVCAQEQDNKTARGTEGQAGADAHR